MVHLRMVHSAGMQTGRPFAPAGVWGDGVEGRRLSSSRRTDVLFQQEQE